MRAEGWAELCPQATSQEHFRSDGFKRIATIHFLSKLDHPVQRFCSRIGVPVIEIRHDFLVPVFHRGKQRVKGWHQGIWNVGKPGLIQSRGLAPVLRLPDIKKLFLESMCCGKDGKVECLRLQNEHLALGEVCASSQKDVLIVHQSALGGVCKACAQLLTDSIRSLGTVGTGSWKRKLAKLG